MPSKTSPAKVAVLQQFDACVLLELRAAMNLLDKYAEIGSTYEGARSLAKLKALGFIRVDTKIQVTQAQRNVEIRAASRDARTIRKQLRAIALTGSSSDLYTLICNLQTAERKREDVENKTYNKTAIVTITPRGVAFIESLEVAVKPEPINRDRRR